MPSSSSSEEDLSKFKEATDSTLYHDSLFKERQDKAQEKPVIVKPPSLRYMEEEEERIHNEIRVTPEFQMHVAKHLSKLLDRQLEVKDKSAENVTPPNQTRSVLKAKRCKHPSDADDSKKNGGVRLFGASAVFLSNLNIVPTAPHRRRKRGRKIACFSSGSESSSEGSDSDDEHNLATSAILPNKILGDSAKYWDTKGGKDDSCIVNKSNILVPVRDDVSRGYESLTEVSSSSNHNSKEVLHVGAKDDMAVLKLNKKKKGAHLESELAASFSSVLSMGSDSQGDVPSYSKKKKIKKKKKHRKEQHSEDATTETTEVEDIVEERRKKVKKGRKSKRQRVEERKNEEMAIIREYVPGLDEDEDNDKWKRKDCKKKKKKREKVKRDESYLKKKCHCKSSKVSKKTTKKKMIKKVSRLSEDLAKLMMNPKEASGGKVEKA